MGLVSTLYCMTHWDNYSSAEHEECGSGEKLSAANVIVSPLKSNPNTWTGLRIKSLIQLKL